jgi:hypothetical protein
MVKDVNTVRIHINNGEAYIDVNPWELVKLVTEDPLKDIDPQIMVACQNIMADSASNLTDYLDPKVTSVFVNKYPMHWKDLREALTTYTDPPPEVDLAWSECQNKVIAAVLMHFAYLALTKPY